MPQSGFNKNRWAVLASRVHDELQERSSNMKVRHLTIGQIRGHDLISDKDSRDLKASKTAEDTFRQELIKLGR